MGVLYREGDYFGGGFMPLSSSDLRREIDAYQTGIQQKKASKSVLVIEDDAPMAEYLASIVDQALPGVEVVVVDTGEDARQEILRAHDVPWWGHQFDLIIIDVFLKGKLNGVDVWNLCRINFPNSHIIFTSSLSKESYHRMLSDIYPIPPFLHKPFKREQCLRMIKEALGIENDPR